MAGRPRKQIVEAVSSPLASPNMPGMARPRAPLRVELPAELQSKMTATELREQGMEALRPHFDDFPRRASEYFATQYGAAIDYEFGFRPMADVMRDPSRVITLCAATQLGKTQAWLMRMLLTLDIIPATCIYTMPTDRDVSDLVGQRWQPMIQMCPWVAHRVQGNIDRVGFTVFSGAGGPSYFFFLPTFSKSVGVSRAGDIYCGDEVERSNQVTVGDMDGRLVDSPIKALWRTANPMWAGGIIDVLLQASDWKRWHSWCPGCKDPVDLMTGWPVGEYQQPACIGGDIGKEFYQCPVCMHPISNQNRADGLWIPLKPENLATGGSGYQMSRIDMPKHSAASVMADVRAKLLSTEESMPEKYIENLILGRPFVSGVATLSRELILAAARRGGHQNIMHLDPTARRQTVMAVDQHKNNFYVLAAIGTTVIFLMKIPRVGSDWSEISSLMTNLNVRMCAVDAGPEYAQSQDFCARWKDRACRINYTSQENPSSELQQTTTIVKDGFVSYSVDRTIAIDKGVEWFYRGDCSLPECDVDDLAEQLTKNATRVLYKRSVRSGETGDRSTKDSWVWIKTGAKDDHWLHVFAYYNIALQLTGSAGEVVFLDGGRREAVAGTTPRQENGMLLASGRRPRGSYRESIGRVRGTGHGGRRQG